jgi:hypothetical protein
MLLIPTGKHNDMWTTVLMSVTTIGGGTNGVLSCLIWLTNNRPSGRQVGAVCVLMALYSLGIWAGIVWQDQRDRGERLARIFLLA